MLTVACLRSTACHYYLTPPRGRAAGVPVALRREDSVDQGVGWWIGRAAGPLGLRGPVEQRRLVALLDGRHPGTDSPLRARQRVAVNGYDLCFSAPKSVSVLFGTAGPEVRREVVGAHLDAVSGAMGYVEDRALCVRRRQEGTRAVMPCGGAAAAAFVHGTSRAGDPHLHTHVVVPNMVHGDDGRWSVADGRGLFAHAQAAGALYRAELRAQLSDRLGVEFQRRSTGHLEISHVHPEVIAEFSGRRSEIVTQLFERSMRSKRAGHVAWASTRQPKTYDGADGEQRDRWRQRALGAGWQPAGFERRPEVVGPEEQGLYVPQIEGGSDGIDERALGVAVASRQVVTRRDVVAAWSDAVVLGAPASEVQQAVEHWVHDDHIGVSEQGVAASRVVVQRQLVNLLGPRPVRARLQPVWQDAARQIDRYRQRWDEAKLPGEGGADPSMVLAKMAPAQLAHALATQRTVTQARLALGRARAPAPRSLDRQIGH